ncbi:hypothetical protein [Actinomadura sp. 6N118]|uniref:hypothetical protein n=1 Tax=Actinomadura sp. 6N118 TaxID=3375151 RepID=UPI0037B9A9AF
MMMRLAATGMLTLGAGAVLMGSTPAMAGEDWEDNGNTQIVGVQACRELNVINLIPIHNVLGQDYQQGDCNNGSTLEDSGYKHNGNEGHAHKHDHHDNGDNGDNGHHDGGHGH